MKVTGIIRDKATQANIGSVKITLNIGGKEEAVLFSDAEGRFGHSDSIEHIGERLSCRVEKSGYETLEVSRDFDQDEVSLKIELIPERAEITVTVRDDADNPLEGVEIALEQQGESIAVGRSDQQGNAVIIIGANLVGESISFKAVLEGFVPATGQIHIERKTALTQKMKAKEEKPAVIKKFNWRIPLYGLIGGFLGGLIGGFVKSPLNIISYIIYGLAVGLALGIGLEDKNKFKRLLIALPVGFLIGGLIFSLLQYVLIIEIGLPSFIKIFLYAIWAGTGGVSLSIGLKNTNRIVWFTFAGLIGGAVGGFFVLLLGLQKGPIYFSAAIILAVSGLALGSILSYVENYEKSD